mgnify:CR=1 FL=1
MTETGKRYGTSLYELAAEEGLTERILAELDVAVNAMQEPGYLRLLMTPSVPKKERCVLLDQAFAQAHPYLVNFFKDLCESRLFCQNCLPAQELTVTDTTRTITFWKLRQYLLLQLGRKCPQQTAGKIAACNRQNHYPDGKSGPSVLGVCGWILAEPAWTALCRAGWNVCVMKSAVW